ncbi:uncharacterized protein LOC128548621 [Mercenaria mercenaria]|uniref:uncharacterized protein LOC128548621 n=1 Tax=Mercenaria mercenaria TaxID=6596 RepID=UPI00234F8051|nr:uncharacterized protein LOC128548621 [Mercenaria mercenaria]
MTSAAEDSQTLLDVIVPTENMGRPRLPKLKFDNCMKLGLALQTTKDGLIGFVNEGIAQFRVNIVQKLQTKSCNECQTENVLNCPTFGICKRKHCQFHNSVGKQPRKCPRSTCNKFRDRIQESHRFGDPSWQNTDATQWVSDSFQIAKCFVSSDECCSGINSIKELDFEGILSIIINNLHFQNKVAANLSEEGSVFFKARDIGRMYHQHSGLFVSDRDLAGYFHVLEDVLKDSKCLLFDRKAQNAVHELEQLEAGSLTISTGRLIAVINDALAVNERKAPKRQCGQGMETLEQNVQKAKLELLMELTDFFTFPAKKFKCSQIETVLSERRLFIDDLKDAVKQFQTALDKERCTTSTHLPGKSLSLGKRDQNTREEAPGSESSKRPRRFEEDKTDDKAWIRCASQTPQEALKLADILLKNNSVPKEETLNRLCVHFGKKSKFFLHLCNRICAYIRSMSRKIVHVYPSYQMLHKNEIVFVVFVEESLSIKNETKLRQNCKVEIRMIDKYSSEGKLVMNSKENYDTELSAPEIDTVKRCLDKFAADLMEKHKYLSLIRASPVRSKDFETGEGKIVKETCIVLYVQTKNYIPIDEEPFQSSYDGIPVDVREGGFVLYTSPRAYERHEHIKMGCKISRDKLIGAEFCFMSGTLGGFVQHPKYGLCGFTCAHALLHYSELEELKDNGGILHWPHFGEFEAISQPENALNIFGRLVQAVYKEGANGSTGVEVALFQIEKRYPTDGDFPSSQTQASQDLRFDSGKTYGCSRLNSDDVVKFGCRTNKTVGKFLMKQGATCVRTQKHHINIQNNFKVTLYNQLEVRSVSDTSGFADFGDSGSLVFMKGEHDEYVCVGMLEGGTSDGTAVVTPISPILEQLDVSKLKSFKKENQARELQGIQRDVRTILQDIHALKSNMPQASQNIPNENQRNNSSS